MKVMLTVLYLTLGIHGQLQPQKSCPQGLGGQRPATIDELEKSVYHVAREKGVPPTVIVNRILRKVRFRMRAEKIRPRNNLQEIALRELLETMARPPQVPGYDDRTRNPSSMKPTVLIAPKYPVQTLSLPPPMGPKHPPLPGFPTSMEAMRPKFYPPDYSQSVYVPLQSLLPPPGVTVRVNAGGAENALPEVTVTISPMMTIVEALRQADAKFRTVLGLPPVSNDVISFSHSSYSGCYVISRFDTVESGPNGAWKLNVSDRNGRVIYDSVCLPSRTEVAVKPGMTITLVYSAL